MTDHPNIRGDIHPEARALMGIPWGEGERDFRPANGATDCLGVVLEFLRRIGIPTEDPWKRVCDAYAKTKDCRAFRPSEWADVTDLERVIGDVAVTHGGEHLSVYVGGGYVLHALHRVGTMLTRQQKVEDIVEWWRWKGDRST